MAKPADAGATRAQALNEWFHGVRSGTPAGPDVGEAFRAGWDAKERQHTAERDALRERIAAYRDAWAVLDAGTETVSVKQAQIDHLHRSRAVLFAALAQPAAADGGSGG